MPRRALPEGTHEEYIRLRVDELLPTVLAARQLGIHEGTAQAWNRRFNIPLRLEQAQADRTRRAAIKRGPTRKPSPTTSTWGAGAADQASVVVPEPIPLSELSSEATRGLEDIAYFASRYFGAVLLPFHVQVVDEVVRLLETPWEEYLITNIAPGAGKSFFKRIVSAWITCRDRTVRGMTGTAVQSLATRDTEALRTAFERTSPTQPSLAAKRSGIACDAVACLAMDYGRFAPTADDPARWRDDGFRVAQHQGVPVADKELSWLAVGMDTKYIGTRVNFAAWDDPHDRARIRTLDGREKMGEDWNDVAEARIETGGLLWVIQQRLGPGDLTSHCMTQRTVSDEDEAEDRPVYHHIRFRVHYDDRCQPEEGKQSKDWACHRPDAEPWPKGCLLYPRKLHWRLLQMKSRQSHYNVVYQQEDADPADRKLKAVHIYGGRDPDTGEHQYGCLDPDRGVAELPREINPPWWSIVCIDPSPTRFWAIGWWLYEPLTERRFLLDLERRRLDADQLIDRLFPSGEFVGLMPEWQERAKRIGAPISHWIYERNAAQRWLLKWHHVQTWVTKEGVHLIPHDTHAANKNAPEEQYGFDCIWPRWRAGQVRLPWSNSARTTSLKIIDEALNYPDGSYNDCLMQQWFFEWNIPRLARPSAKNQQHDRPPYLPERIRDRLVMA